MSRIGLFSLGAGMVALVLALALPSPAPTAAQDLSSAEKRFTVEVSRNGFRVVEGTAHEMGGRTHLAIIQGDQVTVTFVYADTDYEQNNPHVIAISRFGVDSGILDAENPRRSVSFVARRDGEAIFRCVKVCEGHKRLQDGRLMVQASAGGVTLQPTRISVDVPGQLVQGRGATLAAVLTDASGRPVQGEPVSFLVPTELFVKDLVEVGRALTDSSGVAVMPYKPGGAGDIRLIVRFAGDSAYLASESTSILQVLAAAPLYETDVGLAVPHFSPPGVSFGATSWFRIPPAAALGLAVILLAIWGTYLIVLRHVYRISRE